MPPPSSDPKQRFSNRVDDYVKYRPSYPAEILTILRDQFGFSAESRVADIGSGTGLLTQLFLDHGNPVWAVEPNDPMRHSAETLLHDYPHLASVAASAEATTLPDACIDWIAAGQAFHWFEPEATAREWQRILRPNGHVVLVWNTWEQENPTPFMQAYSTLIQRHALDFATASRTKKQDDVSQFFDGEPDAFTLPNPHRYTWDQVLGRVRSSSYMPTPDQPSYAPMLADLRALFDQFAENDTISFDYETKLYVGHLKK